MPAQSPHNAPAPPQPQYPQSDTSESSDEGFDRSFYSDTPSPSCVEKTKIFNDMVHPHLELPAICSRIMNTPQFQRLRNLKQCGLCYYVYPSASHNRFEHCVGTSYLAGKYAKSLRKNQPELNITDEDILCLNIAGLCHDIGHGPYSHTWELFIHAAGHEEYAHEDMSLRMLDYLIEDNNLKRYFEAENLSDLDLIFIKEIIFGKPLPGSEGFVGRKPCKHFLYQIVSNDKTKIDVDKFDYILRDCKQLNVTTVFDYQRVLDNSRVVGYKDGAVCDPIEEDTPTIIVYRKKISDTLEDLFRSRFSLHQKAYQHRVTKIIEEMVQDALLEADSHFKVSGSDGAEYSLSEAWKDPSAFMKLTDSVFEWIINWNMGGPKAAKILNDVVQRKLYTFLGGFTVVNDESIIKDLKDKDPNIILVKSTINYGAGNRNPLKKALYYEKARPHQLTSKSYPDAPQDKRMYIVFRGNTERYTNGMSDRNGDQNEISIESDVQLHTIRKYVKTWSEKHGIDLEYE